MVSRAALIALILAIPAAVTDEARAGPDAASSGRRRTEASSLDRWVSSVVSRVSEAGGSSDAVPPRRSPTIRLRVGADGSVETVTIEESSGSSAIDQRALRAARAAAPFPPPPERLLTLEGYTELSFPVEFRRPARR